MQSEREIVEVRQFMGLVLTTDPHDLPPGAARDQINIGCTDEGVLSVRRGTKLVSFESE